MTPVKLRKPTIVYLIGFIAYFIFSLGDTLIKIAAEGYAFTLVFAVSTSAGCLPVLGYLLYKKSFSQIVTKNYTLHLARGILMAAVAYSILKGIILLPLSIAYPILLSAPVFLTIMGVIFFGLVTPIGLLLRVFRKDILKLKLNNKNTYWDKKNNLKNNFKNQF